MYRVMMYANPAFTNFIGHKLYRERTAYICLLYVDSGLTYSISILVNSCKYTVQLTEHTGREQSSPLVHEHDFRKTIHNDSYNNERRHIRMNVRRHLTIYVRRH